MSFVALCALLVATGTKWGTVWLTTPPFPHRLNSHQVDTERNVIAMS